MTLNEIMLTILASTWSGISIGIIISYMFIKRGRKGQKGDMGSPGPHGMKGEDGHVNVKGDTDAPYKMIAVFAGSNQQYLHHYRGSKQHTYIRKIYDLDGLGRDYFTGSDIIGDAFKNKESKEAWDYFQIQWAHLVIFTKK